MEYASSPSATDFEQWANGLPPSPTDTSASTRQARIIDFLQRVGLQPPEWIAILPEPYVVDFEADLSVTVASARSLLVEVRLNNLVRKQAKRRMRRRWWMTRAQREKTANKDKWVFTNSEVAQAFTRVLFLYPKPEAGIAQAILAHASTSSLDELLSYYIHPEQQTNFSCCSFAFRRRRPRPSFKHRENDWLNMATEEGDLEYMSLLCQTGVSENALADALHIALGRGDMELLKLLLRYGARPSPESLAAIRHCVVLNDIELVRLLLSVLECMTDGDWEYCLVPETELHPDGERPGSSRPPTILLTCLAYRPGANSEFLLLRSIISKNLQAMAVILAYADPDPVSCFPEARQRNVDLVHQNENMEARYKSWRFLADAGLLVDRFVLQMELEDSVKMRHLGMVRLLTDVGVSVDHDTYHPPAIQLAVARMDLEILDILRLGVFTKPVAPLLDHVLWSASEDDVLQLIDMFAPWGLAGEPLDRILVGAAERQHAILTQRLIHLGASVEYREASAIKVALRKMNTDILTLLLQGSCSTDILSTTISDALQITQRPERLRAFEVLLAKGLNVDALRPILQSLVTEARDTDSELVCLLRQYGVRADESGDEDMGLIQVTGMARASCFSRGCSARRHGTLHAVCKHRREPPMQRTRRRLPRQ